MTTAKTGHGESAKGVNLQAVLKSQYHAALAMLKQAIDQCPEDLWTADGHGNPIWHIAYHTLFFTHLYLQPRGECFKPWEQHREEYECMGSVPWPPHGPPKIGQPYTRAEILAYWAICDAMVDPAIDALNLAAADCGFPWYPMGKLEHQLVNIRHVQHHAAQRRSHAPRHRRKLQLGRRKTTTIIARWWTGSCGQRSTAFATERARAPGGCGRAQRRHTT